MKRCVPWEREGGAECDPRYSVVGHVFMRHFVFGLNVALSSLLLLLLLTTLIISQPNVHLSEWMRKVL